LVLPGRFYDPTRSTPQVRPHLEIPSRRLQLPDPFFPDRVSEAGNGIEAPLWVYGEVVALRRALFAGQPDDPSALLDILHRARVSLVASVHDLTAKLVPVWPEVQAALVDSVADMTGMVTGDITAQEVARYLPALRSSGIRVEYDNQLRDSAGAWAARRVGVWRVSMGAGSLPVVTPRLTLNSLTRDPLYAPEVESSASRFVRGLLLRRLLASVAGVGPGSVTIPANAEGAHLQAIVAQPGAKLPEASESSAVRFLQTFPDPAAAWAALQEWAGVRYVLTVAKDKFYESHGRSVRAVERAEDVRRDDINVVLPLAWDDKARVVRVTFSRGEDVAQAAAR
jgi:hypothetical protein